MLTKKADFTTKHLTKEQDLKGQAQKGLIKIFHSIDGLLLDVKHKQEIYSVQFRPGVNTVSSFLGELCVLDYE